MCFMVYSRHLLADNLNYAAAVLILNVYLVVVQLAYLLLVVWLVNYVYFLCCGI